MSEELIQRAVANYLDGLALTGRLFWFHCPNSIRTSKSQAGRHKAMGMKAGVPDCTIILPEGKAMFIELKTDKGVLSPKQKEVRETLLSFDCPIHVVYASHEYDAVKQVSTILQGVL